MTVVVCQMEFAASPHKVWETVMNPAMMEAWVTIHRGIEETSDAEPYEGMKMKQTLCLRGFSFKVKWELEECRVDRHAKWVGRGPARSHAETEYTLKRHGEGTLFEYRNEFRPPLGPLGAVASRALVGGLPEREARASLQKLKQLVES
ncbi:MAG: SRPBCC family protein [Solirubrobacteraceae bacterium]